MTCPIYMYKTVGGMSFIDLVQHYTCGFTNTVPYGYEYHYYMCRMTPLLRPVPIIQEYFWKWCLLEYENYSSLIGLQSLQRSIRSTVPIMLSLQLMHRTDGKYVWRSLEHSFYFMVWFDQVWQLLGFFPPPNSLIQPSLLEDHIETWLMQYNCWAFQNFYENNWE